MGAVVPAGARAERCAFLSPFDAQGHGGTSLHHLEAVEEAVERGLICNTTTTLPHKPSSL
eukprot:3857978-Prymnesium_polylepis.2